MGALSQDKAPCALPAQSEGFAGLKRTLDKANKRQGEARANKVVIRT